MARGAGYSVPEAPGSRQGVEHRPSGSGATIRGLGGRILGGLALGLGSPPAGVLVSEVATAEWRTTFGGGLSAFYMVGMVITFILGKVKLSMSDCVSDLSMIMICWVS